MGEKKEILVEVEMEVDMEMGIELPQNPILNARNPKNLPETSPKIRKLTVAIICLENLLEIHIFGGPGVEVEMEMEVEMEILYNPNSGPEIFDQQKLK